MNGLCEQREKQKVTQQQLADAVGINRSAIAHFESGRIKPSLPVALAIARFLNSTVEELFGASVSSDTHTPEAFHA